VINDNAARAKGADASALGNISNGVNQHNYLAYHDGKFTKAMWATIPGIEDQVGQQVKYSTSGWIEMERRNNRARAAAAFRGKGLRITTCTGRVSLHLPRLLAA